MKVHDLFPGPGRPEKVAIFERTYPTDRDIAEVENDGLGLAIQCPVDERSLDF